MACEGAAKKSGTSGGRASKKSCTSHQFTPYANWSETKGCFYLFTPVHTGSHLARPALIRGRLMAFKKCTAGVAWSKGRQNLESVRFTVYGKQYFTPVLPCSNLFKFFTPVPTCLDLFTPVHNCSHLFTPVNTCSHLLTPVHTCSHLFTPIHTSVTIFAQ